MFSAMVTLQAYSSASGLLRAVTDCVRQSAVIGAPQIHTMPPDVDLLVATQPSPSLSEAFATTTPFPSSMGWMAVTKSDVW